MHNNVLKLNNEDILQNELYNKFVNIYNNSFNMNNKVNYFDHCMNNDN
jgi:hypothetical protein